LRHCARSGSHRALPSFPTRRSSDLAWQAFHDAALKLAADEVETRAEMDALDQIGDSVIESIAAYFREKHNLGIVERLTCEVEILDRKSTRLNSSHRTISYAVFCLKK